MPQELHHGHSFALNHITSQKMNLGQVDSIESLAPSWSKQSDKHACRSCLLPPFFPCTMQLLLNLEALYTASQLTFIFS